jgi:hypothetical protein
VALGRRGQVVVSLRATLDLKAMTNTIIYAVGDPANGTFMTIMQVLPLTAAA